MGKGGGGGGGGERIYCYVNFYCYDNFSVALHQNFTKGAKVFQEETIRSSSCATALCRRRPESNK